MTRHVCSSPNEWCSECSPKEFQRFLHDLPRRESAQFFPVQTCTRCAKQFVVGSERDNPLCSGCSTQLEKAKLRLHLAAVAIGSMLVDGVDPGWDDAVEFEQSAVALVKAMRAVEVQS